MTLILDQRPHATAIRAALSTALGQWDAYDDDDVPAVLPSIYATVVLSRRPTSSGRRVDASTGVGSWRLVVRYNGKTVDEARWAQALVTATLNDRRLTVGAEQTTPFRFESEDGIKPDSGWYSGATVWTYCA